ncbi:MAG TPA: flagellar hook-associated protein FlgK [Acidimicrobiia bacterium]|nr:flagellar hook-associated protein FlgK [Acidimicrobiia bacterium]
MSEFSSLQIALRGLQAQHKALDVTGHNIANANTVGYSRQRVDMEADAGPIVPAVFSKYLGSGEGVDIAAITRAADIFLQAQTYVDHSANSALAAQQSVLAQIEQFFGEPSDNGIQSQLTSFWSGWDAVANNSGDQAVRTQLLEQAATVTGSLNRAAASLQALQSATAQQLGATIDEINTTAQGIAELNARIQTAAAAGLDHNDLLDQRDVLLTKLSDLAGITVKHEANDVVNVILSGGPLVTGVRAESLALDASSPSSVVVRWTKDNTVATVTGGTAGGDISVVNDIVPRYLAGLDGVATKLRDTVNAVHAAIGGTVAAAAQDQSATAALSFALTLNGSAPVTVSLAGANWTDDPATLQTALQNALDTALGGAPGQVVATVTQSGGPGTPLSVSIAGADATDALTVSATPGNPGLATLLGDTSLGSDGVGGRALLSGTDATSIAVDPAMVGHPERVGAGSASRGALDGSRALLLAEQANSATGPDADYRQYIVALGVEAQTVNQRAATQSAVTQRSDLAEASQSGVNLDEEMTNMIAYQQAYNAAARFMTAIDETLRTLIQSTGLVGR